jgi:hypothetical protein
MNRAAWFRAGFRSLVAGSVLVLATTAFAADGWVTLPFTPFQLAVAPGAGQVFSKSTPVYGLRVSVLYGIQSKVVGLDLGLFNDADSMSGVAVGFCGITRGNGVGAHLEFGCSVVEADFAGVQTAFVNRVGGQLAGFQFGIANSAQSGAGLQIGLMNLSDSMRGVQLGLLNWNSNGFLPLFPFINFGF